MLWAAKAITQWHASDPRISLRIVGPVLDAKYAQTVEATLAALAAAPATARARVRYVGALPRAQLHEAMRLAAMVLNTSESEGQCNSLLEAMLAGTLVTLPVMLWCMYQCQSRLQAIRIQYTSRIFAPTVEFLVALGALGTVATPDSRLNGALNLRISFYCFDHAKHDYIIVVESCRRQHAEA